jgi:PHD/YefM family antitoxin component YafN of YafNO toxin-antitoxin module
MIKTQIIKKDNKPIAVIIDYDEYMRLKRTARDRMDYRDAVVARKKAKRLISLKEAEKALGL